MADEKDVREQVDGAQSSFVVKRNAKGELAYETKVYVGTTQEEMDAAAQIALKTLATAAAGGYATA